MYSLYGVPFSVEFEAGFIRLLDKLTNGSRIEVNETGKCQLSHFSPSFLSSSFFLPYLLVFSFLSFLPFFLLSFFFPLQSPPSPSSFLPHPHSSVNLDSVHAGTSLFYSPGLLVGGTLEHDCSLQRSIGYSLEPLVLLAPFAKTPLQITLRGLTNGPDDPSVSCTPEMDK